MSDDELPDIKDPMGDDMDGDYDESDDDMPMGGGGDEEPMSLILPDEIKKEILTEAPAANTKTPKRGEKVKVHYVGTLESDGSEFDSSRSRGKTFDFTLGRGQVIKGWDLGVATMKKGEIAKFTLPPQFAYGDSGSPPKIPEKATLIFEVELISWEAKDDVFQDEGVFKNQLKKGTGWKNPKKDDEVMISVKAVAADGTQIEERNDLEYTIGSEALGSISKACEKILLGMKKGEEMELKCSKDYAYGETHPDGATITLKLLEMYETKDVSFVKDKSIMKKQIKEGADWETPKDTSKVKLSVEAVSIGGTPLAGFVAKVLEFSAGSGEVCDALECAVAEMKKGEKAVLTVSSPADVVEEQIGLKDVVATADSRRVVLSLELQEFEKAKDTWDMSEEEKVAFGTARKEVGSALFKAGRLQLALQRYNKVVDLYSNIDKFKEENKTKAKELKKSCELNKSACYIKLKDFAKVKTACTAILKDDRCNVKALFRNAQADFEFKNFADCMRGCKKVVEADPNNREARALLKQAQAGQKEEDKQSKGLFANMCKALGKLPTPETKTDKPIRLEDSDDDDEAAPAASGAAVSSEATPAVSSEATPAAGGEAAPASGEAAPASGEAAPGSGDAAAPVVGEGAKVDEAVKKSDEDASTGAA